MFGQINLKDVIDVTENFTSDLKNTYCRVRISLLIFFYWDFFLLVFFLFPLKSNSYVIAYLSSHVHIY